MATPRDIRRLAFQALYQLDARPDETAERVLESVAFDEEDEGGEFSVGERNKAVLLASSAFGERARADAFMESIAPDWPVHRQAAVDRAILRLAYFEMMSTTTHPKIVVNEAVELAKTFSTDKSPSFINGLLDKALKIALKERGEEAGGEPEVPGSEPVRDEPAAPGV